jgi:enoyl-CoA hydratase/carnithine racemase
VCPAEPDGLVNKVVPAERLDAETKDLAGKLAEFSRLILSMGKRAFYSQINLSDNQAYAYGSEMMVSKLAAQDAGEGMNAFLKNGSLNGNIGDPER